MLRRDYIVGLIDGEGSFTCYIRKSDSKVVKRRALAEPRFYVKLIEKDKGILYKLRDFFDCGNVYFQRDRRKNHQNCYRYEVASREELAKIVIPFFKKNPLRLPSKRKDFMIFCELLDRINRKEHLTRRGIERLYRLKQKMH